MYSTYSIKDWILDPLPTNPRQVVTLDSSLLGVNIFNGRLEQKKDVKAKGICKTLHIIGSVHDRCTLSFEPPSPPEEPVLV